MTIQHAFVMKIVNVRKRTSFKMMLFKELLQGLCVMSGSILMGISMGMATPLATYFSTTWNISEKQIYWFNNITTIVGIFSPFIPLFLAKFMSRRLIFFTYNLAAAITYSMFMALKPSIFWLAILLRGLVGAENGGFSTITPTLLIDVSAVGYPGFFGHLHQVGIVLGIVLMQFLGMFLSWKAMCLISAGFSLIGCGVIWFCPDTTPKGKNKSDTFFTETNVINFSVAITIMVLQQFSGIGAMLNNLSEDLVKAGINFRPEFASVGTMFLQLIGVIICGLTVDKIGRMPLFCGSSIGCGIILILYASTLKYQNTGWLPIFFVAMYLFFFGMALGPLPWFIGPEMFDSIYRPPVAGFVAGSNQIGSIIVGYLFPTMKEIMGLSVGCYFFGCFCIFTAVFGYGNVFDPKVSKPLDLVWFSDEEDEDVEVAFNITEKLKSSMI